MMPAMKPMVPMSTAPVMRTSRDGVVNSFMTHLQNTPSSATDHVIVQSVLCALKLGCTSDLIPQDKFVGVFFPFPCHFGGSLNFRCPFRVAFQSGAKKHTT